MHTQGQEPQSLQDICDQLRSQVEEGDGSKLRVQTVLDAFSERVFGPLLLLPALVVLIPTFGAIPAVPTTMGVFVLMVAGQALVGRKHPWIPRFITQRDVSQERINKALDRFEPWAKRVDWISKPRLRFLVTGRMRRGIALICVLLACALPPLELIPFAAAIPGAGIFFFGLAIISEDGLLGLFGMLTAGGVACVLSWWMWFS